MTFLICCFFLVVSMAGTFYEMKLDYLEFFIISFYLIVYHVQKSSKCDVSKIYSLKNESF